VGSITPLIAALLFVASSSVASAQSIGDGRLPRAFVGAGVAPATDDADSRMRLVGDTSPLMWVIEGGARVAPRIGVGVEFVMPSTLTAETRGHTFDSTGRQEERVLLGLIRGRAWASDRIAVDVLGGAGVLFQHHEERTAPCFSGCAFTVQNDLDRRAPAFSVGADVPIRLAPHVAVSGLVRFYALQRGDTTTGLFATPWQFEFKSSTRFAAGVTARARW
jgi:hypothetical protein